MLSKTLDRIRRASSPQWQATATALQQANKLNIPSLYLQSCREKGSSHDDINKITNSTKLFFGHEAFPPDITTYNEAKIQENNIIQLLGLDQSVANFSKETESQRCGRIIEKVFGRDRDKKGSLDISAEPVSNRKKILNDISSTSPELDMTKNETPNFDNSLITLQCSSNGQIGKGEKATTAKNEETSKNKEQVKEKLILRIKDNQNDEKLKRTSLEEVPTVEQHVEEFNTVPKSTNRTVISQNNNGNKARGIDYMEQTFDELASRCFTSPTNKIDEKLIKEMKKLNRMTNRIMKKKNLKSRIMENKSDGLLEMKTNDFDDLKMYEYNDIKTIAGGTEISLSSSIFPYNRSNLSSTEEKRTYKYEKFPIQHDDSFLSYKIIDTDIEHNEPFPFIQTVSENEFHEKDDTTFAIVPQQNNESQNLTTILNNSEVECNSKSIIPNEAQSLGILECSPGKGNITEKDIIFPIGKETEYYSEADVLYYKTIERDLEAYDRLIDKAKEDKHHITKKERKFNIADETRYQILTYCRSQLDGDSASKSPVDLSYYQNPAMYSSVTMQCDPKLEHGYKITKNIEGDKNISPEIQKDESKASQEYENMELNYVNIGDKRDLANVVCEALATLISRKMSSLSQDPALKDRVLKDILDTSVSKDDLKILPLSELMKRLRTANHIENLAEFIKMCEAQLADINREQDLSQTPQLPYETQCDQKPNPPQPETYSPELVKTSKSSSPSMKVTERETNIDLCSSVPLTKTSNSTAINTSQYVSAVAVPLPQNPLASLLFGNPMPRNDVEYCSNESKEETITDKVKKRLVDFFEAMRVNMASKSEASMNFRNNKNFEPWVPIPSWPTPQVQEKQHLLTPRQGCHGPVHHPDNPPKKGSRKTCPKRTFSLSRFQF